MHRELPQHVSDVFDTNELVTRCMGNLDLAQRVLAKFQAGFEADLTKLEEALHAEDVPLTACIAHRLKGASASAAAHLLRDRMAQLEELAHEGQLTEVASHLEELRGEWRRFRELVLPIR